MTGAVLGEGRNIVSLCQKGDLWDWLTSDHMTWSAEWDVYGVDRIGGKINGAFMCVYIDSVVVHMRLCSWKPPLQFAYLSLGLSHSHARLFLYFLIYFLLLAIKSTFCQIRTDVRHILKDQPMTSIIYMLLKQVLILLSAALYSFFSLEPFI